MTSSVPGKCKIKKIKINGSAHVGDNRVLPVNTHAQFCYYVDVIIVLTSTSCLATHSNLFMLPSNHVILWRHICWRHHEMLTSSWWRHHDMLTSSWRLATVTSSHCVTSRCLAIRTFDLIRSLPVHVTSKVIECKRAGSICLHYWQLQIN